MNDETLEAALRDFKRSVEITRDVRFQANLRLARRQRGSAYVVSLLSLYVIGLSLLPNIMRLAQYQNQILLACSIILSVFVIFTSLIDGAQNFYHQGELLHQCARKIATINHQLKNVDISLNRQAAQSDLERLQLEYQKALDDCPINHDNMDFRREISNKPHLFPSHYGERYRKLSILWYRSTSILLASLWMIPHIAVVVSISFIVFHFIIKNSLPISN